VDLIQLKLTKGIPVILLFSAVCFFANGQAIMYKSLTLETKLDLEEIGTDASQIIDEHLYKVDGIKMSKEFRITNDGKYEYYDGKPVIATARPDGSLEEGYKPITERTFYLEASRLELLTNDLSYPKFVRMTLKEKREALTNNPQWELVLSKRKKLVVKKKENGPALEAFGEKVVQNAAEFLRRMKEPEKKKAMIAAMLDPRGFEIDVAFVDDILEDEPSEPGLEMKDLITHQEEKYKYAYAAKNLIKLPFSQAGARLIGHNKANQNTVLNKSTDK